MQIRLMIQHATYRYTFDCPKPSVFGCALCYIRDENHIPSEVLQTFSKWLWLVVLLIEYRGGDHSSNLRLRLLVKGMQHGRILCSLS